MPSDLRKRFAKLRVWSKGDQRAPHKPLLVLYALSRLQQGKDRLISYRLVDEDLRKLLLEFGPPRQSVHPEYPFSRLVNDGLWEVKGSSGLRVREGNTDYLKSELLKLNTPGGFPEDVHLALMEDQSLVQDIARDLLHSHFSETLHSDILGVLGLSLDVGVAVARKSKRDPEFRPRVLDAYEHRCAVCGFDVVVGGRTLGLEAAHIKWHTAGGPDRVENGLALCSLHHKALDLGACHVEAGGVFLVSEKARGNSGFKEWLLRFHGSRIREPVRDVYAPDPAYLEWHKREVFRGMERPL
jgi:putative restriction endonuclease